MSSETSEARAVGVIVLTYRPDSRLRDVLTALRASTVQPSRVIVIDNASPDDVLRAALQGVNDVEVHRLDVNVGYGAAMNAGARLLAESACQLLVFMTHETVLSPVALDHLTSLAAQPRVGLVGPLLCRLSDRDTVWSAGGRLTRMRLAPRHMQSGQARESVGADAVEVAWLDGACLLARRDAFEAVSGFREDLFLYCEDVDLSCRLRAGGWRVLCDREAVAWQESSSTPPYLEARNRSLVFGVRGVCGVAIDSLARLVFDLVRGRGARRSVLSFRGMRDGIRGRLDPTIALERPR